MREANNKQKKKEKEKERGEKKEYYGLDQDGGSRRVRSSPVLPSVLKVDPRGFADGLERE